MGIHTYVYVCIPVYLYIYTAMCVCTYIYMYNYIHISKSIWWTNNHKSNATTRTNKNRRPWNSSAGNTNCNSNANMNKRWSVWQSGNDSRGLNEKWEEQCFNAFVQENDCNVNRTLHDSAHCNIKWLNAFSYHGKKFSVIDRMISQQNKYETLDDTCFIEEACAIICLILLLRQMMTHASLKKHAPSCVSYFRWSARRWAKRASDYYITILLYHYITILLYCYVTRLLYYYNAILLDY